MNKQEILDYIIHYINTHFGDTVNEVKPDTQLLTTRLLDSISTLQMVNDFEIHFNIEAEAHEVNVDNLDTPHKIADYVMRKLA